MGQKVSIIIRTYNEEYFLDEVLRKVHSQLKDDLDLEVIIVDSGSTDRTLVIAKSHDCKIVKIDKTIFSFGLSLNVGCDAATGDYLVFLSGHCVPVDDFWLISLVQPLIEGKSIYTYGRQCGGKKTKFSENLLFEKFYPKHSLIPQEGYFCNNANAALQKSIWKKYRFDESLTGLEDMHLAKRLFQGGASIGYVAEASVFHFHDETWRTVLRRYEREAIALREIMPEIHITFRDFLRYWISGVLLDSGVALQQNILLEKWDEIILFRFMQFWGSYRGNHDHRQLSRQMKEFYFYPSTQS
jgi:rhamnosyltransferase